MQHTVLHIGGRKYQDHGNWRAQVGGKSQSPPAIKSGCCD